MSRPENSVIDKLREGDLRRKGRSEEVAAEVLRKPALFRSLVQAMQHQDPGVRMRASDAVEKITRHKPEYLFPYKDLLLDTAAKAEQQEVRWHLAQLLPRLKLERTERKQAAGILRSYLGDKSSIVRTFAMQGLADLALSDPSSLPGVEKLIRELAVSGAPAMKSRGKKLLAVLQKRAALLTPRKKRTPSARSSPGRGLPDKA